MESAQCAETSRARSHLMAMLGHDLRDPLQAIANTATFPARRDKGNGSQPAGIA